MIRLFPSDATDFTTLGLGTITDAISCSVSEERNGAYGLTMEYPVDGKLFNKIELRSIIVCKPNPFDPPQAFRVHKISKNINKKVTITADHISYDMNGIVVMPFSAIGFPDIFQQLHDLAQPANPFSFDTDKTTQASYTYTVPAQLRNIIFGESGSIVANFKGEWYFNNYSAYLYDKRGTDRGVEIRYGKDLTDLKQEENCENLYTGVIPYWIDHQDDDKTWTLSGPNYAVNVADAYPDDPPVYNYTKYRVYDSTEYFSEAPNPFEEKLRARTKEIIKEEKIGIPTVSLNISIANLRKRGKNELVSQLLQIKLCDTITVVFPEMNIRTSGRVETTEYDVIRDEYTRLEIGEAKKGVVKRLLSANNKINENNTKIDSTAGKIQNAIASIETYWISYPSQNPQYPEPPAIEVIEDWVQPLDTEPGYSVGNKVLYSGKVWESTISHNRNVPGTTGWTEYTGPTWSKTTPGYRDGYNIWQYTRTKYIDISTPELISGPLNLTGTKGADGKSVNILGSYNTLQELVQAHPTGNIGDAYLVNGDLYVWDPSLGGSGGWHNVGSIKGQSLVSVRKQYIKKQNTTIPSPNDPGWSYNPPEYETGYYIFTREEQTYEDPSEVKYTTGVLDVTLNKFGEQLDQNEQDIGLVVTDDGGGNRVVNTENIVTAINAPGSTAINATQVATSGNQNVEEALSETLKGVTTYYGSFDEGVTPTRESSGWATSSPARQEGKNIWQYVDYYYADNHHEYTPPINLSGTKGADGKSINILGSYNTLAELQAAHPTGNVGDGYLVNGDLYVWDPSLSSGSGGWKNVGTIKGQGLVSSISEYASVRVGEEPGPTTTWTRNTPTFNPYNYIWKRELQTYENPSSTAYTDPVIDYTLTQFGTQLYQDQQKIGLVVKTETGENSIKAAEIIAAVNDDDTSAILLDADKTQITGMLTNGQTTVNGRCIVTGLIASNDGSCYFDLDNNILVANTWKKGRYKIDINSVGGFVPGQGIYMSHEQTGFTPEYWADFMSFEDLRDVDGGIRIRGIMSTGSNPNLLNIRLLNWVGTPEIRADYNNSVFFSSRQMFSGEADIYSESFTTQTINFPNGGYPYSLSGNVHVVATYCDSGNDQKGHIKISNVTREHFDICIQGLPSTDTGPRHVSWIAHMQF